ncbi:MAG: hypothetical protein H0T79_10685 [Deltaproteobacteria bacterium]|nr:hypothetical protein [Deltaproteobacteria bacterium]
MADGSAQTGVTFCCVQCRLLQPPTTVCAECDAPMVAPVELVRELLYYRDMRFVSLRDWGLITAFLGGSSLAIPLLAPLALVSAAALAVHKLRGLRKPQTIAGVQLPPLAMAPGASTYHGIARRFRTTVSSLRDRAPVLIEHAAIRDRRGGVLLRRTEAAPFLLEVEDRPILITGVVRVTGAAQSSRVRRGDPELVRMGIPPDLAIAGDLEVCSVCDGATALAVTGLVEDEAVPELAFHRDEGRIPVMRGRVGAPVLVSDARLIGAALVR